MMAAQSVATPRKRRRWFTFSLRTFLLVLTALSVWMAMESRIVRERREVRCLVKEKRGVLGPELPGQESGPSWFRRLLGDDPMSNIWFPASSRLTIKEEARIKAAFPEAARFGSLGQ